jgi:DNA-binding NarL/FixJ family response regulator
LFRVVRTEPLVDVGAAGSLRPRIVAALEADDLSIAPAGAAADVHVVSVDLSEPVSVRRLRERLNGHVRGRVVVVSPACGPLGMRRAVRAGAASVVLEEELEAVLGAAVRAVAAGLIAVPAALRDRDDRLAFSHREREVLRLAIDGHTNGQIATALFLSESTVKSHLSSAYRKLGAGSRKDAASVLLDPDDGLAEIVLGPGK